MIPAIRIDPSGNYAAASAVTETLLVPEIKLDTISGDPIHGVDTVAAPWKAIYLREGINKAQPLTVTGVSSGAYSLAVDYPSENPLHLQYSVAYEYGIIFFCNTVDTLDATFTVDYTPIGAVVDTHPQLDTLRVGTPTCEALGAYSEANGSGTKAYGTYSCARGSGSRAAGRGSTAEGAASTGFDPQACTVSAGGTVTITGIDATTEFLLGHSVLIFGIDGTALSATATIGTAPAFAANTTFDLVAPLAYGAVASGYVVDVTYGQYGHAEGKSGTRAIGEGSHAGGDDSRAVGTNSFAHGDDNQSLGSQSCSIGDNNEAIGTNSATVGFNNRAYSSESICLGHGCSSAGGNSIAEGQETSTGYTEQSCSLALVAGTTYTITIAGDVTAEFTSGDTVIFLHRSGIYIDEGGGGAIITVPAFGGANTTFNVTLAATLKNLTGVIVSISKGTYAHAEGYQTKAIGQAAHSEGNGSSAFGAASHAENAGEAYGSNSHAEATGTAYGSGSHAEGGGTSLSEKSHTEGSDAVAGGFASHVEGDGCKTCFDADTCTVVAGTAVTIVGDARNRFEAGDTVFLRNIALGTAYMAPKQDIINGAVSYDGANTTFNLTTGIGTNTACDIVDIDFGSFAHAEGSDTSALGSSAHAQGKGTIASGEGAHSEGGAGRIYGPSQAVGENSHAEGSGNMSLSEHTHSQNRDNFAIGLFSHASGELTQASGQWSHTEGKYTVCGFASRACSVVIADPLNPHICSITIAGVDCSSEFLDTHIVVFYFVDGAGAVTEVKTGLVSALAGGASTTFTLTLIGAVGTIWNATGFVVDTQQGEYAHAEGNATNAVGKYSHAEGNGVFASGVAAHAEGDGSTASGYAAHAEGYGAYALGVQSHAEGSGTTASGAAAHAEGLDTLASGGPSHAEGETTEASGYCAHAEGYGTTASHDYAHAEGYQSSTKYPSSHAFSSGIFAAVGDSQGERIHISKTTADAVATPMLCGGAAITLPQSSLFRFTAEIAAIKSADGSCAAYRVVGLVRRVGAAAADLPYAAVVTTEHEDAAPTAMAGCDVTVTVNANDLQINATGLAGTTILWSGTVHFTEVVYALPV